MSFRMFEGQDHAETYRKFRPGPPDSCIERVVEFLKEKYTGELTLAVDLGCGNGQCTAKLSKYFEKVQGTDVSAAQVQKARESSSTAGDNVTYEVSSADKIPAGKQTAQLITASSAAHWFDLPLVYEEGRRVLVPGGVMAFFCVDLLKDYVFLPDPSKNAQINETLSQEVDLVLLDGYYTPPAKVAYNRYKDIEIPYKDFTREYDFVNEIQSSLQSILGLVRTYSGFVTYCEVNGESAGEKFINDLASKLIAITGISEDDVDKLLFINREHYFLIMARV